MITSIQTTSQARLFPLGQPGSNIAPPPVRQIGLRGDKLGGVSVATPSTRSTSAACAPTSSACRYPGTSRSCSTATAAGPGRPASTTSATGTWPAPGTSPTCSTGAREAGVGHVTLWLLSTDNLRRPSDELEPLLRDHRRRRRRAGRAAASPGGCKAVGALDLLPADDGRGAQGGRGGDGRPAGPDGECRRRLRRPARDRRRGARTAAGARRRRHHDRGARRGPRRRPHRRAPLHQGPARPRPGHPDIGRAAAVGVPALAVGALGVLLLRRVWPDFRQIDFLRALRDYGLRQRRYGG